MKYLLACLLFSFLLCTGNQMAGPTTEEGNPPVLTGMVVYTDKKPAGMTKVSLYRSRNEIDSVSPAGITEAETWITTDSNGEYKFNTLASGNYVLEFASIDGKQFAFRKNIQIREGSKIVLDTVELEAPGVICGTVTRGGVIGFNSLEREDGFIDVFINEINRHTVTNMDGEFEMTDVPAGIYTLIFYAADGFYIYSKDSVTVKTADKTSLQKVQLVRIPWLPPPKPFDLVATYDRQTRQATLIWKFFANANIIGFHVERRVNQLLVDTIFTTTDLRYIDTLTDINSGTSVYYVVRSVNDRFVQSYNEGPVSVTVE